MEIVIALVVDVLVALWVRVDTQKRDWSDRKGDGTTWWVLSLLLSPIVALFYLVMRPPALSRPQEVRIVAGPPPMPPALPAPAVAAGWHVDPTQRHQQRYWDGAGWTAHVADDGKSSVDPISDV